MKNRYIKLKNWLMLSLAGILGLQLACSSHNPHNEPTCIYGPPEMLNGGGDYIDDDSIPEDADNEDGDSDGFDFGEDSEK